jgi:hypothetical protein
MKAKIIAILSAILAVCVAFLARSRAQLTKVKVLGKERQKVAEKVAKEGRKRTNEKTKEVKDEFDKGDYSSLNDK